MVAVHIDRWLHVKLRSQMLGQTFITTCSYQYANDDARPDGAALVTFATAWWNAVKSQLQGMTPTVLEFLDVTVRDMSPTNDVEGVYTIPGTVNGTLAADTLALNVTNVLSLRSAVVGRAGRGRMFMLPSTEDQVTASLWTSAFVLAMANLASIVIGFTGTSALHVTFVIASRKQLKLYRVTGYVADNIPDSMRRRLQGRGR